MIAATNRPELIDDAMKRPGRLDKLLKVGLPDAEGRVQILKALARNTPLSADVDLELAAKDPRCDGFSGADMAALIREAAIHALQTLQSNLKLPALLFAPSAYLVASTSLLICNIFSLSCFEFFCEQLLCREINC